MDTFELLPFFVVRPVSLACVHSSIHLVLYMYIHGWMVVCIPSFKPSQICKYGKLSHAFLAHVGLQPMLTLEVSRVSCLSGFMLALDCSFLAHDHCSNKSSPFVTNTCLYNDIVFYLVIKMIFDSCSYTVVLTSCIDAFYCFSIFVVWCSAVSVGMRSHLMVYMNWLELCKQTRAFESWSGSNYSCLTC